MRQRILTLAVVSLLVSTPGWSQEPIKRVDADHSASSSRRETGLPDRVLMQEINDAWATLDPDNAAKYYDKSPGNVFFDAAPLKYSGWPAYARGAREMFATLRSMKYTVGDDAVVNVAGSIAWGTATLRLETVDVKGRRQVTELRWTPVWKKDGANWLLVHEHLSAPIEPPKQ
jgi:ketosteroid isomerase-like protein